MPNQKESHQNHTIGDRVGMAAALVPVGAMGFGIFGSVGKEMCNAAMVSTYGTFSTFAGIGALAVPMMIIPLLITDDLFKNNPFWEQHPHIQSFLKSSLEFVYVVAAIAASTALLGNPVIPTIVPMLIIPAIVWALNNIGNVLETFCPENVATVMEWMNDYFEPQAQRCTSRAY